MVVRGFDAQARGTALLWLAHDKTGRLQQLASACPGALSFAAGLHANGVARCKVAARRFLADVNAGLELNASLHSLIIPWLESGRRLARLPLFEGYRSAIEGAASLYAGAQREVVLRQRLLLRRAEAKVMPSTLTRAPPLLAVTPEDVRSAAWFETHSAVIGILGSAGADDHRAKGFFDFVSKNATALHAVPAFENLLRVAWTYACEVQPVSRHTNLDAFLKPLLEWRDANAERLAQTSFHPYSPLPVLADVWEEGLVRVEPLRVVGDVFKTARAMKNCLVSMLEDIAEGKALMFKATVSGEVLLVHIERRGACFVLHEIRGRANEPPSPVALGALRPWFDALDLVDPDVFPDPDEGGYAEALEEMDRTDGARWWSEGATESCAG